MKQKVLDFAAYAAVRTFIAVVQALSLETCLHVSKFLAYLAGDVLKIRGKVIEDNLRNVFPELGANGVAPISRQMWEHLFVMVCEIAHANRKVHQPNWRRYVRIEGLRPLVATLLEFRPKVILSGHYGNFEFAGYCLGLLGFPSHTIARELDNPYLHRFVNRFRECKGQFILPKQGSAGQVQKVLDDNGVLVLLGDQYAGPKGCWVDFLGRPASCHKAIALFSLSNDAPLLVTYARRTGEPLQFEIGLAGRFDPTTAPQDLCNVRPLTEWYNERLGNVIRTWPGQYWWLHRRWKGKPRVPKSRQAKAAA